MNSLTQPHNTLQELTSEQAFDIDVKIKKLRKGINGDFWVLVEQLEHAREWRVWAVLGHESWESYLAQPEIDLNSKTVNDYIYIYDKTAKYIKTSDMSDNLIGFDIGKLKLLAPYINDGNADDLITKAKALSRSDLRKEITDLRYKDNDIQPIPTGKYNVIYADPPWKYDFYVAGARSIQAHYPVMDDFELKNLPIPSADNSVLFLWATAPKLNTALEVMEAWGFTYKSCSVWDKKKIGMGYWFRGQHELLLVGTKGEYPPPVEGVRVSSVYSEERTEHSKKPQHYYGLIERYCPNGKYLELFGRRKRPNWTTWGNEI